MKTTDEFDNIEVWRPTSADNMDRCTKKDAGSFRFVRVQSYNELFEAYKQACRFITACKVITFIGCIACFIHYAYIGV